MWFGWDGVHLMFSQFTGRQKLRNLEARPQVAVSIVDPADPYRYLELRGIVESIVDDTGNTFINSMAKKYLNVPTNPWGTPDQHALSSRCGLRSPPGCESARCRRHNLLPRAGGEPHRESLRDGVGLSRRAARRA